MNKNLPKIVLIFIFVNLLVLDYKLFFVKEPKQVAIISSVTENGPLPTEKLEITSTPTPTQKPIVVTQQPVISSPREYFISFGTGSSSASEWTDLPGLQVTVDSHSYNRIKTTTFEATLRIPTGNESASVRLFNVTDKHPVWFSEMSMEGGTPKFLSTPITLDSGNKTYQVQMKTSLSYPAYLDQARIHIVTK